MNKKFTITNKDGKNQTAEVNRNFLSALISYQVRTGRNIDFKKAFCYSLSPVPLSISHPDGTRRKTDKSKLKGIIFKGIPVVNNDIEGSGNVTVVVDMMGILNTFTSIPKTYALLADKFVRDLRVDVVADTYKSDSIKTAERKLRGETDKLHIASLQSKTPNSFSRILRNGENKTRLIELIVQYIEQNRMKVLNYTRTAKLVISTWNRCISITASGITEEPELISSLEEADTKIILHCKHIASYIPSVPIILRSHSGDTDIIVLAVALLQEYKERIVFDDGSGKSRRRVKMAEIDLDDEVIDALIGLDAFSGNDFCSSFFRKGNDTCFKVMQRKSKYQQAFSQLGVTWELPDELLNILELFVCGLYNSRCKEVNEARYLQFKKKFEGEDKGIDLANLIPCKLVFMLHATRANYVAGIWKRSCNAHINEPHYSLPVA